MNGQKQRAYIAKRNYWTETEKRILLKGLKKYGSQNIQKLKHLLPNKSINSIAQIIRTYQTIAELGKKDVYSPLDIWSRSGIFSNKNILISETLLLIYLFENHPTPEETAGFNVRQAYKFLYESSKGEPMTNLSQKTTEMLKQLILSVDKAIWPGNERITIDYLFSELSKTESNKCYEKNAMN